MEKQVDLIAWEWCGVVLYGQPGVMFVGATAGRPNILFFWRGMFVGVNGIQLF